VAWELEDLYTDPYEHGGIRAEKFVSRSTKLEDLYPDPCELGRVKP